MAPLAPRLGTALVGAGAALGVLGLALLAGREAPQPPSVLGVAGLVVAFALLAKARRWRAAGAYGTFALRLALALALLTGSVLLSRSPLLLAQALGVAWALGGLGLALGLLIPWTGLYAALAFPLAVPLGGDAPVGAGLALGALALALSDDVTLSVDARLRRRGGLFPTLRREVVVEPVPPRRGPGPGP